jgi:hypothetical protein
MSLLDLSADEFSWMNANMKRNALSKLIKNLSVKDLSTVDVSYEMIGALSSVLLALKDADELTSITPSANTTTLKPAPEQTKSMAELIKSNQKLCACGSPKGGWDQCRDCFHKSKQLEAPLRQGFTNNYPRQQSSGYFNARERSGGNARNDTRKTTHSDSRGNGRNIYNRDEHTDSRSNGHNNSNRDERGSNYSDSRGNVRDNRAKPYEPRSAPMKIEKRRCECGTIILKDHFTKCYACHTAEQPVKIVKRTLVLTTIATPEVQRLSVKDTCLIHFIELNDNGCPDCNADDSGASDVQLCNNSDVHLCAGNNPDELNDEVDNAI